MPIKIDSIQFNHFDLCCNFGLRWYELVNVPGIFQSGQLSLCEYNNGELSIKE